jgi:hypothetical protein
MQDVSLAVASSGIDSKSMILQINIILVLELDIRGFIGLWEFFPLPLHGLAFGQLAISTVST